MVNQLAGSALRSLLKLPSPSSQARGVLRLDPTETPRRHGANASASTAVLGDGSWETESPCGDEALLADFYLSESEPSSSPRRSPPSRVNSECLLDDTSQTRFHVRTEGSATQGSSTPSFPKADTEAPLARRSNDFPQQEISQLSPPHSWPSPVNQAKTPMGWLFALPTEQRDQLQRCLTPRSARRSLVAATLSASGDSFFGGSKPMGQISSRLRGSVAAIASDQLPLHQQVPACLIEDLRKHTQASRRRAFDLEHELKKQAAAHAAEIAAVTDDYRRSCRKTQLHLLAHLAPSRESAMEAVACDQIYDAKFNPQKSFLTV